MGIMRRLAGKSASSFWAEAGRLAPNETPVNYAHLRCRSGQEDLPGTLFLTSHRLIWRAHDPGLPRGAGFEKRLNDIHAVGPIAGHEQPGCFAVAMEQQGQVGALHFFPQRNNRASTTLAEQMYNSILDARKVMTQKQADQD